MASTFFMLLMEPDWQMGPRPLSLSWTHNRTFTGLCFTHSATPGPPQLPTLPLLDAAKLIAIFTFTHSQNKSRVSAADQNMLQTHPKPSV